MQYVRAGNTAGRMANITLLKDGKAKRYSPISAGGSIHVPLAIVDELRPGPEVSVTAACEGSGTLNLDIGILEVNKSG